MLVKFTVSNWMSFLNETSFSMIASLEKQHRERVAVIKGYKAKILPIAAIYGGNASGKTNFFKALSFAKKLVVKGTEPDSLIAVEPFLLHVESGVQPISFYFELFINEVMYEFSFSVTRKFVVEEKLVEISPKEEKTLYHRFSGSPNFDAELSNDRFLEFAFKGTRDNQLFLTNAVSQKVDRFKPIYDWFKDNLVLVAPDSRFDWFRVDEADPRYEIISDMLSKLDTGITRLGLEEVSLDSTSLSEKLKTDLQEFVQKEGSAIGVQTNGMFYVASMKDGKLSLKKLATYHTKSDSTEAKFEMHQESDGSKRIIDLLPIFLEVASAHSKKIYVIDELDRSLHTMLTRQLLESYLDNCSTENRSQLLFTTHDVLLMDQNIFRRDEMWVAERDAHGVSTLISFSEYKDMRYDKDIRKSYLQGRLGGVPRILLGPIFKQDNLQGKPEEFN